MAETLAGRIEELEREARKLILLHKVGHLPDSLTYDCPQLQTLGRLT